jgi:hypothetical protein
MKAFADSEPMSVKASKKLDWRDKVRARGPGSLFTKTTKAVKFSQITPSSKTE